MAEQSAVLYQVSCHFVSQQKLLVKYLEHRINLHCVVCGHAVCL